MKLIFLDIDGVVNTEAHLRWRFKRSGPNGSQEEWCPVACENINTLAERAGDNVGIIISSTWRLGRSFQELRRLIDENGIKVRIMGKTPNHAPHPATRGEEIQAFLRETPIDVENYVILDDDKDMLPEQRDHFVQCDFRDGFANYDKLKQAIQILSQ